MNTRELAILYWIVIILFCLLIFGKGKTLFASLSKIIRSTIFLLLNPISKVIIAINLCYLLMIYYFSYEAHLKISFWGIKDYLIVLFFSVFPIVVYLKKMSLKEVFSSKKTEIINFATIPLFINSSYTLPVIWEMILVFMIVIISISNVFSDEKEQGGFADKFLNFILVSIGIFMLLTSIYQFIINIDDILSIDFWISFAIEPLVWMINIPTIYLIKNMILIERKVIYSDYKNELSSYLKYALSLLIKKIKFRKYLRFKLDDVAVYIQESKELPSYGGICICIELNQQSVTDSILIAIISDAILGTNRYTGVMNQQEKYPNVVEILNKSNELYGFWQDPFISNKYRDSRKDEMQTKELIEGIMLIQKYS